MSFDPSADKESSLSPAPAGAAAPSMRLRMVLAVALVSLLLLALVDGLLALRDDEVRQALGGERLLAVLLRDLLLVALLSGAIALVLDRMLLRPLRRMAASARSFDPTQPPPARELPGEPEAPAELQQLSHSLNRVHKDLWQQLQHEQQRRAGLEQEIERQQHSLTQTRHELDTKIRELGSLSRVDELTGLANRREFDERLRREFKRAQRDRGLLALAVLDLDHFKAYNERYGTAAGDAALARVGQLLAVRFKRDTDVVARLGGEEFVALLPGFDIGAAQGLLEQLREDLLALQVPHERSSTGVLTVSVGLAAYSPAHPYLSAQALMQAADEALYIAKHAGRDRLSLAASGA
ncbi:diguanylate cyclase [Pelomonas sp. KK5]|uniref:GGDEF domain-containing protein n=1 Tax=Pelomonas sp. KK5 TaxID=1855730 RepID=UPI00097BB9A3|nr:GGDEF domain-containing protein [Pelomonas sp. KK5]